MVSIARGRRAPEEGPEWGCFIRRAREESESHVKTFFYLTLHNLPPRAAKDVMSGLESQALLLMGDFKAEEIANLLWAYARLGFTPNTGGLVAGLERRATQVVDDFQPQGIAMTILAYATLGIQPGAGLVAGLERRAVAVVGDFKPQEIANTLWGYARLGIQPELQVTLPLGKCQIPRHTFKFAPSRNRLVRRSLSREDSKLCLP